MNINEKFLPIGTVVRLKEAKKNIMITGFCPVSNDTQGTYDYSACLYPEGMVSSDINFLFNHDQIESILYNGFVNEEEISFKQGLKEFVEKNNTNITNVDLLNQTHNQPIIQPQMFTNNDNQQQ